MQLKVSLRKNSSKSPKIIAFFLSGIYNKLLKKKNVFDNTYVYYIDDTWSMEY